MSHTKFRIHNTPLDNLVSNLRGEVGEIIFTWVLMRDLMAQAGQLRTDDLKADMENRALRTLNILTDKLSDEIIARLAELAEKKIGRLTFYFVHQKLNQFETEIETFGRLVESSRFREKRNYDISHKELPEQWTDHKSIHIPYFKVLRGIALALRLMKRIDRATLGPSSPYLWREMRKKRYEPMRPVKVGDLLLPYLRLSDQQRIEVINQEVAEGKDVWVDMSTKVDGVDATVKVCKEWGVIALGERSIVLEQYPLHSISDISFGPAQADNQQSPELQKEA
ncbi:MAG TPA: hypothetical protein PKN47_20550 [Nitrospira sp.]|nr:hypothetical protein [Nitrospira sp.]